MDTVVDWLLDSDPAIRWQVLRDLADAPPDVVAVERARIGAVGFGARLLSLQTAEGQWGNGTYFPLWTSTSWTLMLLRDFGLLPASPEARQALVRVRQSSRWDHAQEPFFEGETEPCVNGMAVAIGAYFGEDVRSIVDRLLDEQMMDGGWNCEQENGSTRGSFHSTIDVLEGLLEYRHASGADAALTRAERAGQAFLLDRQMLRRLSTGEVIDPQWTRFSYPPRYLYDVLRGLDYLRASGVKPDERVHEAIGLVRQKRTAEGVWLLDNEHAGEVHFPVDEGVEKPSRWNTLRALRVLRWYEGEGLQHEPA
jgi:hypothetical protein